MAMAVEDLAELAVVQLAVAPAAGEGSAAKEESCIGISAAVAATEVDKRIACNSDSLPLNWGNLRMWTF